MTAPPTSPVSRRAAEPPGGRDAELDRYCLRLVARLCRGSRVLRRDWEDLLQEARLLAWQHGDHPLAERVIKLRLIDRIRALYGRSSTTSGVATRRAAMAATMRSLDDLELDQLRSLAAGDDVEAVVIARDTAARIRRGLAELSDGDRMVVIGGARGATLQDMAGRLRLTESGVSRRRRAARQRLRQALAAS